MMDIYREPNGKYLVNVRIQDGTEPCGEYDTEDEAVEACFDAMCVLNHYKREDLKRENIRFHYVSHPKQTSTKLRVWNRTEECYYGVDSECYARGWESRDDFLKYLASHFDADKQSFDGIGIHHLEVVTEVVEITEVRPMPEIVRNYGYLLPDDGKSKAQLKQEVEELRAKLAAAEQQLGTPQHDTPSPTVRLRRRRIQA